MMFERCKNSGFSLTEVLISAGILAVGFMLIATVFPVGIHLTAVATERNIGATAADEAFAKLKIYGVNPTSLPLTGLPPTSQCIVFSAANLPDQTYLRLYENLIGMTTVPGVISGPEIAAVLRDAGLRLNAESLYPSIPEHTYQTDLTLEPKYCWSALCRRTESMSGPRRVQATVMVSRRGIGSAKYASWEPGPDPAGPWVWGTTDRPVPVPIEVEALGTSPTDTIKIPNPDLAGYITENSVLVNSRDGRVMVVLRVEADRLTIVLKDKVFAFTGSPSTCWVVPPPVKYESHTLDPPVVGGRYPCVGVYQQELDF
jgi:hypothetical protein